MVTTGLNQVLHQKDVRTAEVPLTFFLVHRLPGAGAARNVYG